MGETGSGKRSHRCPCQSRIPNPESRPVSQLLEQLIEALRILPGVGRKTANLVMIVAHQSADNICVDTHVHRIANRFGWVETRTPEQTEMALYEVAAKRWWADINLYLVTWGQQVCKPVYPRCGACAIAGLCPRIGVTRTGRV